MSEKILNIWHYTMAISSFFNPWICVTILDDRVLISPSFSYHSATTWVCWRSGCGAEVCRQGELLLHWSPSSRQLSCCRPGKRARWRHRPSFRPALPCPASRWLSIYICLQERTNVYAVKMYINVLFSFADCQDSDPLHSQQWPWRKSHTEFHPHCPGIVCSCKGSICLSIQS